MERKIPIYTEAKLLDVVDNSVKFLDKNKKEVVVQADNLIFCGARITNGKKLKESFEGAAPEIVLIGDCKKPQDIEVALRDAQTFVRSLK